MRKLELRPMLPIVMGILMSGCMHPVWRPIPCPPDPGPAGKAAMAWQRIPGPPRVRGHVLRPALNQPIVAAQIGLSQLNQGIRKPFGRPVNSNERGEFEIDSVTPGRYLLLVRTIGYQALSDTLVMKPDSEVVVAALMVVDVTMLDGCGIVGYNKRVPWWVRR